MKKTLIIASSFALIASLAACKKEAEAPKPAESTTSSNGGMASMPMAGPMMHGASTGTITAIDAAKSTVTLDHHEIAALKWPAMTMSFSAKREQLVDLKVGDKVTFEIDWDGQKGLITKIQKSR
ncbi:copper-binding protein [Novosphingobium aquiterrae]|uniref:Copper-binding protein n=1 Tax=Novosphingobium aquiterrae TaxID=624388 RepID=A0ABV6PI76_9SPHN